MPVRFPPGLISETHDIDRQSLHLYGGRIWTGRSDERDATRILIRDGRVATLEESADRRVHSIDVGGCWVVPGLIDAHLHLVEGGERLEHVNLANLPSRQAFESVIAERHAELAPDAWLVGSGWAEASWGGDAPDKSWLRAAGDRPCVCYRMDLHAAVVNEAVMERIDWSRIPEGGRIVRDEHGAPTGLLAESALWDGVNPILPETTTTRADALCATRLGTPSATV